MTRPTTLDGARRDPRHALLLGAVVMAALAFVRGFALAALIPPFNAPDEPAHFDYVQRLGEEGRLPRLEPGARMFSSEVSALARALTTTLAFRPDVRVPALRAIELPSSSDVGARSTTGWSPSAPYPPLYYFTASLAYRATRDLPLLRRIFAVRLVSVAWSVFAVVGAYAAGAWFFGRIRDGFLLATLFLVQPMLALASGHVTNDAALFACAAWSFAALARLASHQGRVASLSLLALAATAGALTKPTFLLLLPVLYAGALLGLGVRRRANWWLTGCALLPALVCGMGWSLHSGRAMEALFPAFQPGPALGEYLRTSVFDWERIKLLWGTTFWMSWGWLDTELAPEFYHVIWCFLALATAGALLGWRSLSTRERTLCGFGLFSSLVVLGSLYAIDFRLLRAGTLFLQGRYLLPLFPLLAACIVVGLRAMSRVLRARVDAAWTFAATLTVVSCSTILRVLVRYYS